MKADGGRRAPAAVQERLGVRQVHPPHPGYMRGTVFLAVGFWKGIERESGERGGSERERGGRERRERERERGKR